MGKFLTVLPSEIKPSQDFLKEGTVRFIMTCIATGKPEALPPTPVVRMSLDGVGFIAIDGHNLIAVKDYLGQPVEVFAADTAEDGLKNVTVTGADERNADLKHKFESVIHDAEVVAVQGIASFDQLIAKYPNLFPS